jgi:hypothetical protein
VLIVEEEPETENEPVTNKLPDIFNEEPSNVKPLSAIAPFGVPSEVNTLLSPGVVTVLNPVPDVPDEPLVPALPEVPDEPLVPTLPDVPDDPDDPDVP